MLQALDEPPTIELVDAFLDEVLAGDLAVWTPTGWGSLNQVDEDGTCWVDGKRWTRDEVLTVAEYEDRTAETLAAVRRVDAHRRARIDAATNPAERRAAWAAWRTPSDALGRPIDPSPAGRRGAAVAFEAATGYPASRSCTDGEWTAVHRSTRQDHR